MLLKNKYYPILYYPFSCNNYDNSYITGLPQQWNKFLYNLSGLVADLKIGTFMETLESYENFPRFKLTII